jgi:hypothetical protein
MAASFNKPFFHVIDVETTGRSPGHRQTGLFQIYASNLPPYQGALPWDPRTFVKPSPGYVDPRTSQFTPFTFNYEKGEPVLRAARKLGVSSEEESARIFFEAASKFEEQRDIFKRTARINTQAVPGRRFIFAGWNPEYDKGVLEEIAQRYPSLEQYRGFFKRPGVSVLHLEKPFLDLAFMYGQENPEFARRYFRMAASTPIGKGVGPGAIPKSPGEMRYVSGWGLENVVRAAGGQERLIGIGAQHHEAVADVRLEEQLFERSRTAKKLVGRGYSFDVAMRSAGLLAEGETAETFFTKTYASEWSKRLAQQAERGIALKPPTANRFAGAATKVLLVAAAATAAYAIAHSKREDRQTSITGLSDTGLSAKLRHETTDFGSGWQGQDNRTKQLAETLLTGAAVFAAHKWATANWAGYAEGVYRTLKIIEERSPSELFRTFGLSQLQSSYLVNEVFLRPEQLIYGTSLTATGEHIQRLTGLNPLDFKRGMQFRRASKYSAYLELEGKPGVAVRFAERGRLTGASARYGGELYEPLPGRTSASSVYGEFKDLFRQRQRRQEPRSPLTKRGAFVFEAGGEKRLYEPLFGQRAGLIGRMQSAFEKGERVAFEWAERPLRLLANIGMGLEQGTYNKLFHIPVIGEGGMLNQLMLKRVLPAYLAVTAARYINYQLGNRPAEIAAGIPLKAKVAWAEATDKIPGLRELTDKYAEIVPGPQYGPLALPIAGGAIGAFAHYASVARGTITYGARAARVKAARLAFRKGALIGGLAMLPLLPGMIGSRQTADELRRIYSGEQEVPIRAGRWWDVGSTPFRGGRIKYFRQHWYPLMQSKAELTATYGSEDAYWEHHPMLHPFKYIKDPYWLERAQYYSRPYPITSPAFSNIPLIGHLLAATVGRIVKPEIRMHEREWDINNYTLYSSRLEPKMELGGLPPSVPRTEYNIKDILKREAISFAEFTGLPGFIAMTLYGKVGPQGVMGKDVVLQGSRQLTNWSRQYYERELGAVSGFNPVDVSGMPFGYSEPLRRFIQPERGIPAANEIPNAMPRWLPGEDYMVNFRTGDPFAKIPEGGARLPGPGYEALHPELAGLRPEEYPDIARYKILADIAPYSKEYMIYRAKIRGQAQKDSRLAIEFSQIEEQVRQVKESTIQFDKRRFTAPIENLIGTIKTATPQGITLAEYPGRTFTLSSLGMSAADLSAAALGEANADNIAAVEEKQTKLQEYLADLIGKEAALVVPAGTQEHAAEARAVIFVSDTNINRQIIDSGLGTFRKDQGGAEAQAMFSSVQQSLGRYAETLAFTGEGGPLRAIPTPFHTKYWNERTALALYEEQEVYGARMRRWQRPFHDMVAPWARGLYRRITGTALVPPEVEHRREMDSLVDELDYLRGYIQAAAHPQAKGRYTSQTKRTNVGANLFGSPGFIATTLPRREKLYFPTFLQETDPEKRQQILQSVSPELARALTSQWVKTDAMLARAEGKEVPPIEEGGVLFTKKGLKEYAEAETSLSYSDFVRSQQIAQTFSKLGFEIPGPGSPLWSEGMDYEDVKLKIIQNEGYDYHDFNIYDDRASLLWRKPYVDGAVRELTSGGTSNSERLRQTVERIIIEGLDKNPTVTSNAQSSLTAGSNVTINVDEQGDKDILRDIRRNAEEYREEATA